jgi:hypothetical protein
MRGECAQHEILTSLVCLIYFSVYSIFMATKCIYEKVLVHSVMEHFSIVQFEPNLNSTHFRISNYHIIVMLIDKSKAIPATDRGDQYCCEMSRLPHFLDNRLTDGGEAVSLTRRPAARNPQENSWYSFLLETESTPGPE